MELVATILWSLWNNRNGKIFEGTSKDQLSLVSLATSFWKDYQEAVQSSLHGSPVPTSAPTFFKGQL